MGDKKNLVNAIMIKFGIIRSEKKSSCIKSNALFSSFDYYGFSDE